MKKLSTIFVILIFTISIIVCGCSASGKVSVNKQQSGKSVNLLK